MQVHVSDKKESLVFLLLIVLTALLILAFLLSAYLIPMKGLNALPHFVKWTLVTILGLTGMFVIITFSSLSWVVIAGRDSPVPFSRFLRTIAIRYFLPIFIAVGKLIGLSKQQVQHAFVGVNNRLVLHQCLNGKRPERILLLMPHCLQYSECPVKITYRVENCKRCGKCVIKDLLEISEKYGTALRVATGGTIARRIVIETKPELIIAVACERDLTSGIQDTTPLPVYGIFNRRPHGPCFNTQVDVKEIEAILKEIRGKG